MQKTIILWLRRDLRLHDNTALSLAIQEAKSSGAKIIPLFIFDSQILSRLKHNNDRRVQFIYQVVDSLKRQIQSFQSDLKIFHGNPKEILPQIINNYRVQKVFCSRDYDPYSRARDEFIEKHCRSIGVDFISCKDHVIFEKTEILNKKNLPYTVYTPYQKAWVEKLNYHRLVLNKNLLQSQNYETSDVKYHLINTKTEPICSLESLGFLNTAELQFPSLNINEEIIKNYNQTRDLPFLEKGTSKLGLHLRFGTISIRELAAFALSLDETFLKELIWREFFAQILWNFPHVVKSSFRPEYDKIDWRTSNEDFERWSQGETGFPLIDAGMRELLQTGHMHNRVRMLVASFFTKNLLLYWHQGERFFSQILLDYELASNNGNWQWAAGCGCDAAPYFRIFNPETQRAKFDPENIYIQKWIPEWSTSKYPKPMVSLKQTHHRAIMTYKKALN